jgi:hypothetical protein
MNFGYLIVVSKNDTHDYHKMAALLALSIKRTQKEGYDKVALATDDKSVISLYSSLPTFDRVIYWEKKIGWDNRSYMNQISPWKYTICLDADMLFVRDHSHWVDYFVNNSDLYICSKIFNFKNEPVVNDVCHRNATVQNSMPNLYSAFSFFNNQSKIASDFFILSQYITEYPNEFKNLYYEKSKPLVMGTDEIFSLAARILDIEETISYPLEFPKFIHMKSAIQNVENISDNWKIDLGFNINAIDNIKIGPFCQTDIIHYVDKSVVDLGLFELYKEKLIKNFKL